MTDYIIGCWLLGILILLIGGAWFLGLHHKVEQSKPGRPLTPEERADLRYGRERV